MNGRCRIGRLYKFAPFCLPNSGSSRFESLLRIFNVPVFRLSNSAISSFLSNYILAYLHTDFLYYLTFYHGLSNIDPIQETVVDQGFARLGGGGQGNVFAPLRHSVHRGGEALSEHASQVTWQGGLCLGALCLGASVWGGGLCPGGSLSGGVSVHGGRVSLSRGVSVKETPLCSHERAARILPKCILVWQMFAGNCMKMKEIGAPFLDLPMWNIPSK